MKDNATMQTFANQYLALSSDLPLSKISISMITQRCGMSRKSFYYYFKDREELSVWIFQQKVARELEGLAPTRLLVRDGNRTPYYLKTESDPLATHRLFLQALSTSLIEQRAFFAKALRESQPGNLTDFFIGLYRPIAKALVLYAQAPNAPCALAADLTADLYVRSLAGFYREHLEEMSSDTISPYQGVLYGLANFLLSSREAPHVL